MEQAPPRSRWSPAPGWALRIKGRRVFRAPLLSDTWDGDDITFFIFPSSCHPGKQELPLAYWFEIASDLILLVTSSDGGKREEREEKFL